MRGSRPGTGEGPAAPGRPRHARPATDPPPAVIRPTRPHAPRHLARRSWRPGSTAVWPLAAAVVLALVAARALPAPVRPGEGVLAADGYLASTGAGLPAGPLTPEGAGALHVAGYAAVTRAFDRDASVVLAGREVLVAATLLAAALLWWAARRAGLASGASVAALLFGIPVLLLVSAGLDVPAVLAAPWLAGACCLLPGRGTALARAAAGVLAAIAVVLAPDTAVLLLAGVAFLAADRSGVPGRSRWAPAAAGACGAVALAVLLRLLDGDGPPAAAGVRNGLLVAGAACVLAGAAAAWQVPALRAAGLAVALTAVTGLVPPLRPGAVVLCLPAAALLAGAVVEEARSRPAARARGRPAVAAGLLLAAAVAAVAVPAGGPPPGDGPQTALLRWARDQLPAATPLAAERLPAAELRHAGASRGRVPLAGDAGRSGLRVSDGSAPGLPIARFSGNGGTLVVTDPSPGSPTAAELARRRNLAAAVLANPTTRAPGSVRSVLRSAAVDPRLLSLIAALAAQSGVEITALPRAAGETADSPARSALLGSVGGMPLRRGSADIQDVLLWLRAQRAPYAPDTVAVVGDGVLFGYRYASAPDALVTRSTR